jgi:hypothetical protein
MPLIIVDAIEGALFASAASRDQRKGFFGA